MIGQHVSAAIWSRFARINSAFPLADETDHEGRPPAPCSALLPRADDTWDSPATDIDAAEKLINECGYHRRDEELADAKAVIMGVTK